jgi:hypothetical protein
MLREETQRGPDFLRLANALSRRLLKNHCQSTVEAW